MNFEHYLTTPKLQNNSGVQPAADTISEFNKGRTFEYRTEGQRDEPNTEQCSYCSKFLQPSRKETVIKAEHCRIRYKLNRSRLYFQSPWV